MSRWIISASRSDPCRSGEREWTKMDATRVRWDQVDKWVQRAGLKSVWHVYGMPEIVDPYRSRFAEVDVLPRWDVPDQVLISVAITGAFYSKRVNPNQPVTPDEIRREAEACIRAGAPTVHIHVRDDRGYNVLSPERFHQVVDPLRARYPDVVFDGCLVAVTDQETEAMRVAVKERILEVVPVNTTSVFCGDSLFAKPPHVIIEKTRLILENGLKPQIAVYAESDVDNARRYLLESGLVPRPSYWIVLPALPGCTPMHNPRAMVEGLMRMVNLIRDVDPQALILVCAAGRASTYLATLALLLGLHVRVGMEDTIWPWPHRDERLESNVQHFRLLRQIAEALGRRVMTPPEYRALIGLKQPEPAPAERGGGLA